MLSLTLRAIEKAIAFFTKFVLNLKHLMEFYIKSLYRDKYIL